MSGVADDNDAAAERLARALRYCDMRMDYLSTGYWDEYEYSGGEEEVWPISEAARAAVLAAVRERSSTGDDEWLNVGIFGGDSVNEGGLLLITGSGATWRRHTVSPAGILAGIDTQTADDQTTYRRAEYEANLAAFRADEAAGRSAILRGTFVTYTGGRSRGNAHFASHNALHEATRLSAEGHACVTIHRVGHALDVATCPYARAPQQCATCQESVHYYDAYRVLDDAVTECRGCVTARYFTRGDGSTYNGIGLGGGNTTGVDHGAIERILNGTAMDHGDVVDE